MKRISLIYYFVFNRKVKILYDDVLLPSILCIYLNIRFHLILNFVNNSVLNIISRHIHSIIQIIIMIMIIIHFPKSKNPVTILLIDSGYSFVLIHSLRFQYIDYYSFYYLIHIDFSALYIVLRITSVTYVSMH